MPVPGLAKQALLRNRLSAVSLAHSSERADRIRDDGAGAVIPGGAGLIGIAAMIQPRLDMAVICSNAAGFRAAAGRRSDMTTDAVESAGLSPGLTHMPAQGRAQP